MKLNLPDVTLAIVDCVDYGRAKLSQMYCKRHINFGAEKILTHLDVKNDPTCVKIENINSIQKYTDFLVRDLNAHFDTSHVLVAQWDGFVRDASLWSDEFLQYDYIGAPWPEHILFPGVPKHFNVGNGGFSLRSKKLQSLLSTDKNLTWHHSEDVLIAQLNRAYLESKGIKFAPLKLANIFSWEYYGDNHPTFGVHARERIIK